MSNYHLQVGEKGKHRLGILNNMLNPSTQAFIKKIGIREGMKILDFGCGTGIMSRWFSEQVGATGKVFSVDNSHEQLALTKELCKDQKNMEFHQADAYHLDQLKLDVDVDLIFVRLVLVHLTKPKEVFHNLTNFLKKGGVIISYEPVLSHYIFYPEHKVLTQQRQVMRELFEKQGKDCDLGLKLFATFKNENLEILDSEYYAMIGKTYDEKYQVIRSFMESKDVIIKEKIMTEEEFNKMIFDLEEVLKDETLIYIPVGHMMVAGKR